MNLTKILLDATELEHPKPFEKAVLILNELDDNSYLYMLHKREPLPLLELAKNRGFTYVLKKDSDDLWHILFTKDKDINLLELLDV